MSNDIFTEIPEFAFELYQRFRYKVLYGGRGSGKSWAIAQALILAAVKSPIRIACFREHQKNIEQSSYQVLADWIIRLGLESYFRVLKTTIIARNGSRFIFQGMSTTTEEGIKSMENISIAWFEEAHRMTQRSWELLSKTIRAENSEIWLSFNPRFRYDPVYRTFVVRKRPGAFVRKVNYHLNPWFPKELEEERIIDKVQEPERYAHIWLGEPDDEGQVRKVIPYAVAQACVDAWGMRPKTPAMYHVGFDVADTGRIGIQRLPETVHVFKVLIHGMLETQTYRQGGRTTLAINMGPGLCIMTVGVSGPGFGDISPNSKNRSIIQFNP